MTKVQVLLAGLPDETKQQFIPLFGNVDKFYTVMYLIAKNEHITGNEKPDRYPDWMVRNWLPMLPATILKTMLILGSLPLCLLTKSLLEQLIK